MRNHTGRVCFGTTTATAAVLAAMANPVHAQETTTPLGRIVFGWGTDQVALDTPQAVTVIDQEEIEQQQATTVGEFFDGVPSVQGIGSERVLGGTFNIRGWGEVPAGDEGRVVVLQDGATQYYEQYRIGSFFSDPNLFCNIEVLRGPASATLYGSAAIGGVIRFETCDVDDVLADGQTSQFRFSLGGETNGAGGNVSLRYATRLSENVDVFANLNYRRADDYVDGDGDEISGSAFDAISGVISTTYHFSSTRSLRLIYESWSSDLDDTEYEQTGSGGFFGEVDRRTHDQTVSAIYNSAESFGDLEMTLAYSDTEIRQENATGTGSILFEDSDYGYRTLSLDARVTTDGSLGNIATTTIYGATISQQVRTAETDVTGPVSFHPEGTSTRLALFGQTELDFGNGFTLIPGMRVELALNDPAPDNPASPLDDGNSSTEIVSFSPKLAFTYDISDEWGVFGSIAQTQRAPNLDELYSFSLPAPNRGVPGGRQAAGDLDPETAYSAELGFTYSRGGLLNDNDAFDARVTAYYSYVEDLIQTGPPGGFEHVNVDEAEIYGLELEAAYVGEQFYANLAVSIIEGRNLTEDEIWTQLPQDNLHLTIGHRNDVTGFGVGWTVNAYADLDYEGAQGSRAQNDFGGYATHDVFASYAPQSGALEGLEFRVGADNIFDRDYRNALDQEDGRGLTGRFTIARVWNF
ncbi:TonB-dependent receptor [Gymnodinialimonas sp. 2305UL16-5]|uniref:TonB-dependent receptor domain-containing protein n=1 Tax=Gymnodinialimonas mytili TaxID=3126503 RepID=UPI0030B4AAE7